MDKSDRKPGMALAVKRPPSIKSGLPLPSYTHYGIYEGMLQGCEYVIHYNGEFFDKLNARIEEIPLSDFHKGDEWRIEDFGLKYSDAVREKSLQKARSRLGEQKYHPTENNCEHFARWCVTGVSKSQQVIDALKAAAKVAAVVAVAGIGYLTGRKRM